MPDIFCYDMAVKLPSNITFYKYRCKTYNERYNWLNARFIYYVTTATTGIFRRKESASLLVEHTGVVS